MMQDMSMYCLDIVMNSIKAQATEIKITLIDSKEEDVLSLRIEDNGCGMSEAMQARVCDPFFTTRTTRKVGLGVAFFKSMAMQCEGNFELSSKENVGTMIYSSVKKSHWDAPPLGNMPETLITLIQAKENIHYIFSYQSDKGLFILDTEEIKVILDGVSLLEPSILIWIKEYVSEQLALI